MTPLSSPGYGADATGLVCDFGRLDRVHAGARLTVPSMPFTLYAQNSPKIGENGIFQANTKG